MDICEKLYPLSESQEAFYEEWTKCPHKQLLNIGTYIALQIDVDFDILQECILEAYESCECLHVRFVEDKDGKIKQYIDNDAKLDISFFEFAHWKEEDAENEMQKWTSSASEVLNCPLCRIVMISMPGGYKGLFMLVNHMIMDAQALVSFYVYVLKLYVNKKYGLEYPKPMQSFVKALEKELKYYDNSKAYIKDKQFWAEFAKLPEPVYTDITGDKTLQSLREETGNSNLRAAVRRSNEYFSDITCFHLEPNPSDVLVHYCIENNISMSSLLLMALRTYLQKVNNNEPDISINNAVARRATLLEKFSGGSRVQFFPCRTVMQTNETFLNGCKKMQENQSQIFRHTNFPTREIFKMRSEYHSTPQGLGYEPISLTYQPLSIRSSDLPDIKSKFKWFCNGVATQSIYLTVMHGSLDNGLDFVFEHRKDCFTFTDLQKIYYFITRILFEGIKRPDITIGEVINNT